MKLYIVFLSFFLSSQILGQVIAVGEAKLEKSKFIVSLKASSTGFVDPKVERFSRIVYEDFSFYKERFETLFKKGNLSLEEQKNAYVIKFKVIQGKGLLGYELLSDQGAKLTEGSVPLAKLSVRKNAHTISDQAFKRITGEKSIFLSSIVFVSDRESKRKDTIKEVYSMDFDGENKKRLTYHRGMVISPAVSSDGSKILYSLISRNVKKRNINLYLLDLKTNKSQVISSVKGLNSGAVFMPGDQSILLTLSHQNNAEIYQMNLKTRSLKRLTKHYAPDVDPSISADGRYMAFLSGRSIGPNIYRMRLSGGESSTERISYVGKFNATPRFSPDGSEIAFSSWMDNRFDIYRISADKTKLFRLTKDFGSNEDPTYSNDGQFIAFSSQKVISERLAVNNIYVMSREGEIIKKITHDYGKCITPRWTK